MHHNDAFKILKNTAAGSDKMWKFYTLAVQIGVNPNTLYGWWRRGRIPQWRLAAFAKLRKVAK